MKLFLTILLATTLTGFSALAANDRLVRQSLDEVGAAQNQVSQLIRVRQAPEVAERLRYVQERLLLAEELLQNSLRDTGRGDRCPTPTPPSRPDYGFTSFELYSSDRCNGFLIGRVSPSTSCDQVYSGGSQTWGVKVNGQCTDTYDMPSALACKTLRGVGDSRSFKIYNSDTCSGGLIAAVSFNDTCDSLRGAFPGTIAWGIRRDDGVCENISDVNPYDACVRLR